ncbi:hypothetical protein Desaci_2389 [Desulfosporosinus acidiphilus SJ4]|uniref:Uncharacterized protein n=1 Tax=Desulfosporosinus acidiphilus (strain DSM 22704 / JCM 16185 / SJ4) TaxID=646529 RepID=I4D6B8_DESAJ|nr:hypothetical protein [Desulfosporosinus acidiphilus]AFM41342.1 hypothetical protein Desaci_2389 [Desulfosporosinus acidiphilus SJ4]
MESKFEAAVVTVQDKNVAVISVNRNIFHDSDNAIMIIKAMLPVFPGMPVILMTIDPQGNPAYFGRSDLILLLETLNIKEASWKEITAEIDLSKTCPTKEAGDM